ncbi:MAG TPA: hypothetical protein VF808_20400 [Ktedonobacterales bacterium]
MAGIARVEESGGAALTSDGADSRSQWSVRPRQVGTLLWLRWTLGLRAYRRRLSSIVGAVAMVVFILGFGLTSSILTGLGYHYLPRSAAEQLLFATLTFLYVAWVALPIVQYAVNEGLDVSKLATYPLTRAERMVALTLATLLDPATFIIAALFTAVLISWGAGPLPVAIGVVALLAFYVHTVGMSQMAVAALVGMLRSRRYRDLSVVIFALMSVTCSLAGQFATTLLRHADGLSLLGRLDIGRYAQWLPPGMAARAILQANAGDPLGALAWLLALVALVPVLLTAWAWTLDRSVTSAESAGGGRPLRRRVSPEGAAAMARPARAGRPWISPVVAAVAVKDLRYLWRDPQIKASLLSSLVLLLVVFAPNLAHADHAPAHPDFFYERMAGMEPLLAPLPALLIVLTLSVNALGLERQGLGTLLLFPARPLDILWGKNLAVALVALVAQVGLIAASCAVTGAWPAAWLALVEGVAATLTLLGAGNITSTLLPLRVRSLAVGSGSVSSDNGCLRSVISLGALWGTLIALAPVFVLLLMPPLLGRREWLAVAAPLALLYGLAMYQIATRLIAPWLGKRAPEIVALTARDE